MKCGLEDGVIMVHENHNSVMRSKSRDCYFQFLNDNILMRMYRESFIRVICKEYFKFLERYQKEYNDYTIFRGRNKRLLFKILVRNTGSAGGLTNHS